MRTRVVLALTFLFFLATAARGQEAAGGPGPTPDENPAGNAGALKPQIQTGGSYDAHSGNATRIVNDLHVPSALGVYGLDFTRYWNSTHNDLAYPDGEWPLDFGASGWSHSWHWHAELITYSESLGDNEEEIFYTYIVVTFPDGHMTKFKIVRSNRAHGIPPNVAPPDPRLGPPYTQPEINAGWPYGGMGIHDHLNNMEVNGREFWLSLADGGSVHFVYNETFGYQATEVFDPHGLKTDLRYNASGDLYQIEQEGGRSLNLTWGTFPDGSHVITRVDTGGNAGSQHVTYQYRRQDGYSYALTLVIYPDDPAPGQTSYAVYSYGTCFGDEPEPCDTMGATAPMLKRADDPRFAGAMTRIHYNFAGTACAPHAIRPWLYPEWVDGQVYRVVAEKSETDVVVSSFLLVCDGGERLETNGLGGVRKFYFGRAANTFEGTPPHFGCLGYQLGKVSDFTSSGYVPEGLPCPAGVPCHRQNYEFGNPRHIWDGRNIMTDEIAAAADDTGLPYQINYADGSHSYDDRFTPGDSYSLDACMHNPYNHWLFKKTDGRGQVTTYRRDGRRRVIEIHYPDTSTEYFEYNEFNQVTRHTLPSLAIETYVYDPNTHLLMQEYNSADGTDALKEYTYDSLGRVATMREGRARSMGAPFTVRMTYNGRHKVLSVEYAAANPPYPTVRYEYDNYGNCTAIIDELGHRSVYTYDSYRRCTSYTEPLNGPGWNGGGNVASRTWNWVYDRVAPDGVTTFPASAHTSSKWRLQIDPPFNSTGDRRATARDYDCNDRLNFEFVGIIVPAATPQGPWIYDEGAMHRYAYDGNGQKSSYIDPKNRETTYDYDNRNRLWKSNEYPYPNTGVPRTTETLYNAAGNKILVIFPDGKTQEWPDANYDAFGQPHLFIDERINTTNMDYWPWGPMKKLAQVTTHRSKDGGGTEDQLTAFFPDLMGRPWRTNFPDGTFEENTYQFEQVRTWTTRRTQTKTITYDVRGREQSHTWSDNTPGVTRIWDAANRLTSISNVFSAIDFGYDDAGQVWWEGNDVNGGNGRTQINYCRYPSGEVSQISYPNGATVVNRFYTARGQLGSVGWGSGATSYVYLPDGKVDSQLRTNGVTTSYGYDGRGMIGSVRHSKDGHDLAKRDYWRDDRDRIVAWKRGTDTYYNQMEDGSGNRYGYDPEGQLTAASYRAFNPETGTPSGALRTDVFAYDQLGNRQGQNHVANRGQWMTMQRRNNGLNQYISWENDHPAPDPAHWGSGIFYDDNFGSPGVPPGNGVMTAEGYISASFNALNQPVGMWVSNYGSNYLWFGYDPLGRCVKRWKGPAAAGTPGYNPATYFYYDGSNMVQEGPSGASADRAYVHGGRIDEIVASQVSGVWYNHHYDAQGNSILLSNVSGGLQEQYDYDAFGFPYFYNAAGGKGTPHTRFLFTGREWIVDMRIYDYRARQYQPELGRFLQPDPIQFEAGDYNLYRYCHNDPINKSDPDGKFWWVVLGAVIAYFANADVSDAPTLDSAPVPRSDGTLKMAVAIAAGPTKVARLGAAGATFGAKKLLNAMTNKAVSPRSPIKQITKEAFKKVESGAVKPKPPLEVPKKEPIPAPREIPHDISY